MNSKQKEDRNLRLKGLSYNEINKLLGIPKSTLSTWFSNLTLPESASNRLAKRIRQGTLNGLVKRNRLQTTLAIERARRNRKRQEQLIRSLSKYDLLVIGAVTYWGEGYKKLKVINGKERTGHIISLTNSDPDLISSFILFLEKILDIPKDKIKLNVRIFKHISSKSAIRYWQKISGLKKENIEKPVYVVSRASQGKPDCHMAQLKCELIALINFMRL